MKTYEDLAAIAGKPSEVMQFVFDAITDHKASKLYDEAKVAYEYFKKRCETYGFSQSEMIRTALDNLVIKPVLKFSPVNKELLSKMDELIKAGSEMVDRMAMRRNEWRDWMGLEYDPEMEELLALENYIPADRLGDQSKLTGGET